MDIQYKTLALLIMTVLLTACSDDPSSYTLSLRSPIVTHTERVDAIQLNNDLAAFSALNGGRKPSDLFLDLTTTRVNERGERTVRFRLNSASAYLAHRTGNGIELTDDALHLPVAVRLMAEGSGYELLRSDDNVTLTPRARVSVDPPNTDAAALLALRSLLASANNRPPTRDERLRVIGADDAVLIIFGLAITSVAVCAIAHPLVCSAITRNDCGKRGGTVSANATCRFGFSGVEATCPHVCTPGP